MTSLEFATASRILFGDGKRRAILEIARPLGRRCLIVTGRNPARASWLIDELTGNGIQCRVHSVAGEPTIAMAETGAAAARSEQCDFVIAVGGGSAIDAGKAIAALATNNAGVMEYLEVIGKGRPLEATPLPCIAVPTTAGTGAEVTRNAVLASPEHQIKVSLRSPKMLPVAAIVDPELTHNLPREVTPSSGLDALTQLIEPFLCTRANPLTDALCREALPRVARALPQVCRDGTDRSARSDMSLASLFGGLALANAGLGVVHGFAAPIGGMFDAPHGGVCAALLPGAMAVNLMALKKRAFNSPALTRFHELGRLLTGNDHAGADEAVRWIDDLCSGLNVPKLRSNGVDAESFPLLCERAAKASSMKANPVELTPGELREILDRSQ